MKQAIMEVIEETKELVHDIVVEVMEDVSMIRAKVKTPVLYTETRFSVY